MILSTETNPLDVEKMLAFYKTHFSVVEVVKCLKCNNFLAFECSGGDGMGLSPNELGKFIIPIGDNMLSHRVRLDKTPGGERMVGYQCGAPVPNPLYPAAVAAHNAAVAKYDKQYEIDKAAAIEAENDEPTYAPPLMDDVAKTVPCGNDTRVAEIEIGLVPVGSTQTQLSPFEKFQISEQLENDPKYKADFSEKGNVKTYETFSVERV